MLCKGCGEALPSESHISVEIDKSNGNKYSLRPTHKGCEAKNGGSYQARTISVDSDAAKTSKMKEFILHWYKLKGVDLPKCVVDRFGVLVLCPLCKVDCTPESIMCEWCDDFWCCKRPDCEDALKGHEHVCDKILNCQQQMQQDKGQQSAACAGSEVFGGK